MIYICPVLKIIVMIKGTIYKNGLGYTLEYKFRGKLYIFFGQFYYNKKLNRFEHTHIGPRGGEYLVVAK